MEIGRYMYGILRKRESHHGSRDVERRGRNHRIVCGIRTNITTYSFAIRNR